MPRRRWPKSAPTRTDLWSKHPTAKKILLDPGGPPARFRRVRRSLRQGRNAGSRSRLRRGRTRWLPAEWRERADLLVSLSGHDHAARTGARRAGGTDLSGVYNVARASVPALACSFSAVQHVELRSICPGLNENRTARTNPQGEDSKHTVRTEGLWLKCDGCREIIWKKDLESTFNTCGKCGHHFRMDARARLDHAFRRRHLRGTGRRARILRPACTSSIRNPIRSV